MRSICYLLLPLLFRTVLQCQAAPAVSNEGIATFHSKVPVVLVDIVVTNGRGEPVTGLKGGDFQIFEDGKPQTIASFEEHKNEPPTPVELPPMPAGVFTNFPTFVSADSLNVLLVDGLNTQRQDQDFVHAELLKYLKTIPPGARVAVFILTARLRMLQGFTSDSSALLAAVNSKNAIAASPLLQSEVEKQAQERLVRLIAANRMGPPPERLTDRMMDPVQVLQQAFAETTVRMSEARMHITLGAMQDLARYLPLPGRKNVMWVSGSFPTFFLPDSSLPNPFFSSTQFPSAIRRTADLLTNARVAIYPIAAHGLAANELYQANSMPVSETRPSSVTQANQLSNEVRQNFSLHQTMEELAKDTGGLAFYDTNGIGDALTHVTNSTASFYTMSYTPTNRKVDGKYRHISVKLVTAKDKLSYRRGYFAETEEDNARGQGPDPLLPLLSFGMPDISQIIYKVRAAASKMQGEEKSGDAAVQVKGAGTMYSVDFAISLDNLKLDVTPDGVHHGKVELKVVAYSDSGKLLNMVGGSFALSIKPENFADNASARAANDPDN